MSGTLLDWPIYSLSIFNAVALFWLGITVLLNTARRSAGTWVITVGLFGAGLFFISHAAILGIGVDIFGRPIEVWWRLGWIPLIILPLCWYFVVLWYAGFPDPEKVSRAHRILAPVSVLLASGLEAIVSVPAWKPSFGSMAALRTSSAISIANLPLLVTAFPLFALVCISLSIVVLRASQPAETREFTHARQRAYPWLVAVSLTLLVICLAVAVGMVWVSPYFDSGWTESRLAAAAGVFDFGISALIGLAILFLGQALVRYEVFMDVVVPRKELKLGWRRVVVLGAGYGLIAGEPSFSACMLFASCCLRP